ncbi:MAG: hypothetical protein RLY20_3238 [Verrucomicrobiota bacterium]
MEHRPTTIKMKYILTCIVALLFVGVCPMSSLAQKSMPSGGYAAASVTNKEVCTAAAFAIEAHQKALQETNITKGAKLELVAILKAEQQVVAGMNYCLQLKVKLNGKEKTAETLVWWQPWRKPDPYKLTSWTWK